MPLSCARALLGMIYYVSKRLEELEDDWHSVKETLGNAGVFVLPHGM